MSAASPRPGAEINGDGRTGTPASKEANDGTEALRDDLARTLVVKFSPAHLDDEYRTEMAARKMRIPAPADDSTMVTFTASDGHLSMRPLTYGEIADELLANGFRRVVEDDATVERIARGLWRDDIADVPISDTDSNWAIAGANGSYQSKARAAVRALREDT